MAEQKILGIAAGDLHYHCMTLKVFIDESIIRNKTPMLATGKKCRILLQMIIILLATGGGII